LAGVPVKVVYFNAMLSVVQVTVLCHRLIPEQKIYTKRDNTLFVQRNIIKDVTVVREEREMSTKRVSM
jgi:hypothetical protein